MNTHKVESYIFKNKEGTETEATVETFSVPENRSTANDKTIQLSFVRFKSTNPNPGNPIVYLAGGPGGSGTGTAKGPRYKLFMALREIADVIAFDQRGTGLSNSIPTCHEPFELALDQPGTAKDFLEKTKLPSKKCMEFWKEQGFDVTAYNTLESAKDLDDLRKVLGVEKLNLWGISYGSHLAFAYIKQFSQRVDRMVMAGLEGPDQTIKRPKYNEAFLQYLSDKVKEDSQAGKHYPDVLGTMRLVFDRLEKTPVFTKFTNPYTKEELKLAVGKFDLQLATSFMLLKNPSDSKNLPFLFYQMKAGDFSSIAPLIGRMKLFAGKSPYRLMPTAMDAMSGISKKRWTIIQEEAKTATLGRTTNFPYPDAIPILGLPDLGDEFRTNPISFVPALFFSGTLDGRTYIPEAKELVSGFENGVHIILDGAGHDLFMSTEKVTTIMLNFFRGAKIESQTISIGMPEWVLPPTAKK